MLKSYYAIHAVTNGYTVSKYTSGGRTEEWIARSWAEVLELLAEIKAPDFVTVKDEVTE